MSALNSIELLATGCVWVGGAVGLIDTALNRLFAEARSEILITAYSVTFADELIIPLMRGALERGVKIGITVNRVSRQPPSLRGPLGRLGREFPYLDYRSYEGEETSDLHAKLVVADRQVAIVGSSNLTRRAMNDNVEIGLLVKGPAAAEVARLYDRIRAAPETIKVDCSGSALPSV
jgi:phosphatidylserine/phosphatidylglycerophosphate/cardiolipin synthase-like enzyme